MDTTAVPFYFDSKEAATLKKLRERIIWYCEQKGYANQTDEFYNARLKGFLYKITDKFVLERLVPSMVLQQFNILLAQIEGKAVKNKETIYKPISNELTREQVEEVRLIKEVAYPRLQKISRESLGDKARLAVHGTQTASASTGSLVKTVIRELKTDTKKQQ